MTECFICSNSNNNLYKCTCCKNRVCYECISKYTDFEKINNTLYILFKCFFCRTINYINIFSNDLNNFKYLFKQILENSIKQKETIIILENIIISGE